MNKKDAYALGTAMAMLKKQYGLVDLTAHSHHWTDLELNKALYKGWNSVPDMEPEHYWEVGIPECDGVYRVQDCDYDPLDIRWARYDSTMGWTKSTSNRSSLNRPTLPFIEGGFPWKK